MNPLRALYNMLRRAPFLEFTCDCGHALVLRDAVLPGQLALLPCDNCGERWAVICPPLEVRNVRDVEELWPQIAS